MKKFKALVGTKKYKHLSPQGRIDVKNAYKTGKRGKRK